MKVNGRGTPTLKSSKEDFKSYPLGQGELDRRPWKPRYKLTQRVAQKRRVQKHASWTGLWFVRNYGLSAGRGRFREYRPRTAEREPKKSRV